MSNAILKNAENAMKILKKLPNVNNCKLYGSLANGTYDELSDIDVEINVSGYDNGKFMMELEGLLSDKLNIVFSDYAPSLIPDKYIVSFAIDEENPFLILDLCCMAEPHCKTVTKEQAISANNLFSHMLKLWVANVKHFSRGKDCYSDIIRMASKIGIPDTGIKNEKELLKNVLIWLEENKTDSTSEYIESCKKYFDNLI